MRRTGPPPAVSNDDRIHPFGVSLERAANVRRRASPLSLRGTAKAEGQKSLVDRHEVLSEQLGQMPRGRAPVELHLPQSIPPLQIAYRHPGVIPRARSDVRDAEAIEPHLHRGLQTRKGDSAV